MKTNVRWLVCAACASLSPLRSDPAACAQMPIDQTPERIAALMMDAAEAGQLDRAHELGKQLLAATPEAPMTFYNLACQLAKHGDRDRAVEWLTRSAERGFRFEAKMLRDEDLDSIREHPKFLLPVELIRANVARSLEAFKVQVAKDAVVLTEVPKTVDPAKPASLIVVLHGYGGGAKGILQAWSKTARDFAAIVIAPQALDKGGDGFSWTVSYEAEYLVLHAIEETRKKHNIDLNRIVVTGFSQGGLTTFNLALTHPTMFKGAIPIAGFYDPRVAPVPTKPGTKLPRFAILNGEQDQEAANNRATGKLIEATGTPVLVNIYPGVGHAFLPNRDRDLAAALKFVLE
jgi:phospholipase/carboxylesterase